jgi:hypothetical protein
MMNMESAFIHFTFTREGYRLILDDIKRKIVGLIHTPSRVRRVLTILAGQGFGCLSILFARITRVAVVVLKGCLAAAPRFSEMQQ